MKKYIPLTIGFLAVIFLLAFAVGQGRAQEASPESGRAVSPEAPSASSDYIPIQGRLTDASGNPLNGSYTVIFRLYETYEGGTALCEDSRNVQVNNGLFSYYFKGCTAALDGRQLYLGIQVGSDAEMTPRQYIDNVPYAWTLRPGAVISASLGSIPNLHLETWSTNGRGLRAYAMATTGTNYGIVGASRSPDGFGGYFYNNGGGVGLYGSTNSTTDGKGVYGVTTATTGTTYGVYGESNSPSGRGVYGVSDSTVSGIGVFGEAEAGNGVSGNSSSGWGVYSHSTSNWAVYADTGRADQNYGLYTSDNSFSANYHTKGAIRQVVQNGGSEPLEAGDVVVFSGMVAPADINEPPVILVSKTTAGNSTAVAGVVFGRYSLEGATLEGAAQPGEYLLLVVQGPARVKVSAAAGAIQPGDLLSSSAQAGVAASAAKITMEGVQTVLPGTVFAKALEALESGEGWIYVFVTLQ